MTKTASPPASGTAVATVVRYRPQIDTLAETSKKYNPVTLRGMEALDRAFTTAQGIQELRAAVTPLMPLIAALHNSPLGFDSDRNPTKGPLKDGPYPAEVVVDCVVEALMRGLQLSGNEFNLLMSRCYTTLNGYKRLVEELPGITDLDHAQSPPFTQGGHTCVKVNATWQYNGVKMRLKDASGNPWAIYAIRANAGMGADGIIGKAKRRMYKAIYEKCTGTRFTEPEEEVPSLPAPEPEATQPATKTEAIAQQIGPAGVTGEQLTALAELRGRVLPEDWQAALMKRKKESVSGLTREEAREIIGELRPLADDGVSEPPPAE